MRITILFCSLLSLAGAAPRSHCLTRRPTASVAFRRTARRRPLACPACASTSHCNADGKNAAASAAATCPACHTSVHGGDNATALAMGVLGGEGLRSATALVFSLAASTSCSTVAASTLAAVRDSRAAMTAATADLRRFFWALAAAAPYCKGGSLAGVIERALFDYIGGFGSDVSSAPFADRLRVSTAAAAQWMAPRAITLGPGFLPSVALNVVSQEQQNQAATATTTSAGPCLNQGLADPASASQCTAACGRAVQKWARANLVVQGEAAPIGTACVLQGTNLSLLTPLSPIRDGHDVLCSPNFSLNSNTYLKFYMNETVLASRLAKPISSYTIGNICDALQAGYTGVFSSLEECYLAYSVSTCSGSVSDPAATARPVCSLTMLPEGGFVNMVAFLSHPSASTVLTASDFQICLNATATSESLDAESKLAAFAKVLRPVF